VTDSRISHRGARATACPRRRPRRRPLAAALLAALGACAWWGAAAARADRFKAYVRPVPVGPYQKLTKIRGESHVTTAPGFSQLTIDLRNLAPGRTYNFSLRQAVRAGNPCKASSGAAAAGPVPGWTFFPFVANSSGRGHGVGTSNAFAPAAGATYYVDAREPGGLELACGVLKVVASPSPPRPKPGAPPGSHPRHRHRHHRHRRKRHRRHHRHHRHRHRHRHAA
jgi:hypothetical protein